MSLLDKNKKVKNASPKKDKKPNDLIKNTLPLDEGMIIGFYDSSNMTKLKDNVKIMNESYDATKEQEKKKKIIKFFIEVLNLYFFLKYFILIIP